MVEKSPSVNHLRSPNHDPTITLPYKRKNRRILEGVFESKKKS